MKESHKIFGYLDDLIESYNEPISRVDGLLRNPKEVIRTIEFYSNSQYLSGNKDSLGREKPFYNVCNYRVTVAKTSTDIDVKDIRFEPDSLKHSIQSMILNKELYKYLKDSNFSLTINEMGFTRPKYGGVLVKKTMKGDDLNIEVLDWTNIDFDPNDVIGGTRVETFYMQPSELSEMRDVWEVDEALKAHAKFTKGKPGKIEVKEVFGELPDSFYPGNEGNKEYKDNGDYKLMCFYIAIVGNKKYLLYYKYEKENNVKYLPWEKYGKSLGVGVVEDGFESQVWQNDSIISYKNIMDLASKIVITTDSQKVSGNAITGVDHGHIFQLEQGRSMNVLSLMPNAIPQIENLIGLWNTQYDKISSTYAANTGEAPTAGTPYSQTALLNQVANSPFEYRREEWGIFLNEILNDWILPHLKKEVMSEHILVSDYDDAELEMIDESIANFDSNKSILKDLFENDNLATPHEQQMMISGSKQSLKKHGKKREIIVPEGFLEVGGRITANITGELKNKGAMLQSLDSIFKTVVSTFNPNTGEYSALKDPVLSKIFGQIVEMSGAPVSFASMHSSIPTQSAPVQTADLSAINPVPAK